jgi:hypothetical protein
MNKDIIESTNITPGPSKAVFLHYYKEIWTNISLQENYLNTENVEDSIITMEKLKEALKIGKSPGENNLNSELYKSAGYLFHQGLMVFNNICMMGEVLDEWKKQYFHTHNQKGHKQKLKNYRGISPLNACCKLYSNIMNEKLKAQAFLSECQNGFRKSRSCID